MDKEIFHAHTTLKTYSYHSKIQRLESESVLQRIGQSSKTKAVK